MSGRAPNLGPKERVGVCDQAGPGDRVAKLGLKAGPCASTAGTARRAQTESEIPCLVGVAGKD